MKILALVAIEEGTEEDLKRDGKKTLKLLIGQDVEILFCDYSTIEIQRDGELSITCLGEMLEKPDYFWPLLCSTDGFVIENMLLEAGVECVINLKEFRTARSKIATYQRLTKNGFRVPDTVVFFQKSDPKTLVQRFSYPFVVKPDNGYGGNGVELIHNEQELAAYFETLSYGQAYVAQEYISTSKGRDLRVVILHGKYYFSMERRTAAPEEFRSNVHLGGTVKVVELSEKEKKFCEKVASVFDLPILGIDLMIGDGEYVLAEVNAFPGISDGKKMIDAYASVLQNFISHSLDQKM